MKTTLTVFTTASVFCFLLFATCKKEGSSGINTPVPPPEITGTWSGIYSDSVSSGTFTFTLVQQDTMITGTYSATSSTGFTGGGSVGGTQSGKNFKIRTTSVVNNCTIVNDVAGSFTGSSIGSTLSGTYSGSNSCGGGWSGGVLSLTKQ